MRIGLVSPYSFDRPGGVQNHILGLADWLRGRGHEARIAGPGNHAGITSLGKAVPVRFNGSTARICLDPSTGRRLRTWAAGLDLIHVHEPLVPLIGILATRLGKPLVLTCHAATSPRLHSLTAPAMRYWRKAQVIAVSDVAAQAPRAAGISPHMIGNGISARLRNNSRTSEQVVFVGRRDEPRKGFQVFATAMTSLRSTHPDLEVVVVGAGRAGPDGFRYLGELSDAERDSQLNASRVFAAPNLGGESFGIVLLEALAAGADLVASDLPAFRRLLTDDEGPVARLVPPGDSLALKHAVNDALSNGPISSVERRHAIAARFDWSCVGPQIESVYGLSLSIA